jgi:hypothetical protein
MLFAQSTGTITQTVNDRNTIGVLSATPNGTITAGNPIAFTYILNTAGAPAPTTETVQFYDGTTALGTPQTIGLISAANLLPYSQVNTGQGWTTSGTTPTVASLTANGPDGSTNTATALTFVNSTSTVLYAVPGTTNYANQQVTFSIWAESATPTTLNLIVQDSPFVAANKSAPCSVTSTWQRCTLTYTFPANAGTGFAVSLNSSNYGVPINVWGAQFEQAGQAGPYVSTIGTARPTGAQAGTVAFSWSQFQTGVHTVTVQYPGDANFVGSTSNAVVLTAQQEIPKIVLTDSPASTSVYGQAVTLTAQLSDQDNDDNWIPTGTVRQHRAANRRHQQSAEGRLDHRDRQKRYRRHRHTKSVTDQGSQTADSASPSKREEVIRQRAASRLQLRAREPRPFDLRCVVCGRTGRLLDPFPRTCTRR